MVSLPRNQFIAILIGVCVLSAGIGSGLALLAQTGPAGAVGKRGPAGPRGPKGPEGPSGAAEVEGVEAEVQELRGAVEESAETQSRLESLEEELSGFSGANPELCEELGEVFC